ncbi:MAG TPA: hypothetical protein VHE55_17440 [Fimbriimonadaceae bacterium]|nr:hypothetical protein [Fimbriimonadaceae bacterium]
MRRGFSITELLTSVVCLGALAAAIFGGPFFINNREKMARWRGIALQLDRNAIDAQRSAAAQGTVAAGTTVTNPSNTGIPFSVTVTTATSNLGNNLFSVTATATFTIQLYDGASQLQTVNLSTEVYQGVG